MATRKIKSKPRIAIYIEGGVLNDVFSNIPDPKIVLIDYDNLRESGFSRDGVNQLWKMATKNLKRAY